METQLCTYIDAARARLVAMEPPGPRSWRDFVEKALGEAYAQADLSALSRVVQLLVNLLESEGRFEDALHEIDAALVVARPDPGAAASLKALKASMLIAGGSLAAVALAEEAAEGARLHLAGTPRLKALVLCEIVRLQALEAPTQDLEAVLADSVSEHGGLDQLFVLSWLIPYYAARGETDRAFPLVRTIRALARAQRATFREADVLVFERWIAAIHGAPPPSDELPGPLQANTLAGWRMAALSLTAAVTRRDREAMDQGLRRLLRAKLTLRSDTGSVDNWAALESASTGTWPVGSAAPKPPASVTLSSLASALVGASAVALAGRAEDAAEWLAWISRLRRRGIRSSLEFPVAAQRLEGLLAVRAGMPAVGRRHLELAREWAELAGYVVEEPIAHLQSLELQGKLFRKHSCQKDAAVELRGVEEQLLALGLDPVPYLFTVHKSWDAAGSRSRTGLLTTREVQVLAELAHGVTYKQAAATLGIAWPTVQTVAHHVYQKLGVSNRVQAVDEGRRLGLL